MERTIYSYNNPRQFLADRVCEMQKRDPQFSLRRWSKKMGMQSHTLLVMLLQGKRPLRVKHATFFSKGLNLDFQANLYLQALIQADRAETPEEKHLCSLWLSDLNPGSDFRTRELDEFAAISHWVHGAIMAMTELKDFSPSPRAISSRLGGRVSPAEVQAAITRLLSLNLLEHDLDGKLRPTCQRLTSRNDVADRGARQYHAQVIELAKSAIEQVPMDRREFQAFSIAIPLEKIPVAKEMIRKFRAQFAQAVQGDRNDEVFQMNVQLFQLTERRESESSDSKYEGADTDLKPQGKKGETVC